MIKQVMVLGATGNFGSKIAKGLAKKNIPLIIAGRNKKNLETLEQAIQLDFPDLLLHNIAFDVKDNFSAHLKTLKPFIVINTCGPFQAADYSIALSCIKLDIHYIDLADSRSFVTGIGILNDLARKNDCSVITGASTVPGLSSAVLEHYKKEFSSLDSLRFGITPGQKTERGLATTAAILSYVGKALKPAWGTTQKTYGWQNLYRQSYPILGKRWMANCDIPDLDLLPQYYGLTSIQFSAGIENTVLHLGLWTLSWLVRLGLPLKLENHAQKLLKLSDYFDRFGSDEGGMHMILRGKDLQGKPKTIKWFLIAKKGNGPYIPTIPTIVLTEKIMKGTFNKGAMACVGLITLEEYLTELKEFDIHTYTD